MKFKTYQCETLTALEAFLTRARAQGPEAAFYHATGGLPYRGLEGLPEAPYACLRLPTGGGKTILAAKAVQLVGDAFLGRARPVTLWMVPSDAIKSQVIVALNDTSHPYRKMLDQAFGGEVRIFDIENFTELRPHDLRTKACIIVSTIQSFRVQDTTSRAVYKHHEMLEPHFSGAYDPANLETVSDEEASKKGLTSGEVKFSFANLMHRERPIMIVDEAHNAVSELSGEMQRRLNPSAIIEFTATPKGRNNILHSVTAAALKAEEMIKLPIILKTAPDWETAVSLTIAKRAELAEAGKADKDQIRPIALYQAQPAGGVASPEAILDRIKAEEGRDDHIVIATGNERGLDGIDLNDPNCKIEHIITIEALKEGWDCPGAYILCATQRMASATKIEQLLGRVLRMPGAERRTQSVLNQAYAFVSDPNVLDVAARLRDKLISMGFTDEEVSDNLKTGAIKRDRETGRLVARDDETLPLFEHSFEPAAATPERLEAVAASGGTIFVEDTGRVTVAKQDPVQDDLFENLKAMAPAEEHPVLVAKRANHDTAHEHLKSPAERGESIAVPGMASFAQGDCVSAHDDTVFELCPWRLDPATACIAEGELRFEDDGRVTVIDLDEPEQKIVWRSASAVTPELPGTRGGAEQELDALRRLLERRCKRQSLPQDELAPWLKALVTSLNTERKLSAQTMLKFEGPLVAAVNVKLKSLERSARRAAFEQAFETTEVDLRPVSSRFVFDKHSYEDVKLDAPAGGVVLDKHLLGGRRIPRLDGKPLGEEMECAYALNGMEEVDLWVRNIARHPRSLCFMRPEGDRYYPDFIAKLTDGRILVVEYKGAHLLSDPATLEKEKIARRWADVTGNLYALVTKTDEHFDLAPQLQRVIDGA